ncbi:MAG TPA: acyloxyacyl hydrolase, partial [Bacteroidia bacterium]|nr:acyloxyacyl hydrolase [Bacteroidia bacterium]
MWKLKLILPIISVFLFSTFKSIGQDSIRSGSWLSATVHYGFILPIYTQDMNVLLTGHCPGIEVDYLNKPSGNQPWQLDYHYAETGLAFFYSSLGNPTQLGNELGLYPYINFHLQRSARERLYLRAGLGLAYLPVIFNQQTNHKDILIGSHINAMINLRLAYHYYISNTLRLETGFGITHCSNGSFNTPNLGINLVTFNTGISYCINEHKVLAHTPQPDTSDRSKLSQELYLGVGASKLEPPGGARYPATTLTYVMYHTLTKKSRIGGGIDVFYNKANLVNIADDSIPIH